MFDMKALAVEETGFLHLMGHKNELLHDGAKKVGITLWSPGSLAFAAAETWRDNQLMEAATEAVEKGVKVEQTPDQKNEIEATFLAMTTKSFDHWSYTGADGKALDGIEMFKAAYRDRSIGFVKAQVQKKLNRWGNFAKGSATS